MPNANPMLETPAGARAPDNTMLLYIDLQRSPPGAGHPPPSLRFAPYLKDYGARATREEVLETILELNALPAPPPWNDPPDLPGALDLQMSGGRVELIYYIRFGNWSFADKMITYKSPPTDPHMYYGLEYYDLGDPGMARKAVRVINRNTDTNMYYINLHLEEEQMLGGAPRVTRLIIDPDNNNDGSGPPD